MGKSNNPFRLKGHEKFALRDGWLNKGLQAISNNSDNLGISRVFLDNDGPDVFGVGNNMVKSIRYWLKAFNLIVEKPGKGASLSDLGKLIFQYDPYLEDITTLWFLHSNIAKNADNSTVWYLLFNKCDIDEFTKEEIGILLRRELEKYIGGSNYSESSLKDDIDVLLNMYCKERSINYDPEDKNVCPLSALNLIKKSKDVYKKMQPDIGKLSEWVILYELIGMFNKENMNLSIERISAGNMGISKIYNIGRITINDYLDRLEHMHYIHVDRTAGLDIVYLEKKIDALVVVEEYYKTHR